MLKKINAVKFIALLLSLVMTIGFVPINSFAQDKDGNNFSVDYQVTNSWVDSEKVQRNQINITITNTGSNPIEDWQLYYDFHGEIEQIWNAAVIENGVIGNLGWNGNILPNASVEFGYVLKSDGINPTEFSLEPVDDIKPDGDKDPVIGFAYFKDMTGIYEEEIGYDEVSETEFARNQILLTAYEDVSFGQVARLAENINADIVGFIELTNDYQLELRAEPFKLPASIPNDESSEWYREFKEADTAAFNSLNELAEELMLNSLVEFAALNIVVNITTIDGEDEDEEEDNGVLGKNIKLTEKNIKDINTDRWNYDAVNIAEAWNFINSEECKYFAPVRIGLIDNQFKNVGYLKFNQLWNNDPKSGADRPNHGNNVAGVMAAKFNKTEKMAGICPEFDLYGFSIYGRVDEVVKAKKASAMSFKYGFALLIGNNVRVINYSLTNSKNLTVNTSIMQNFLQKLLDKGYDFVVVTGAGNDNALASGASFLNAIPDGEVKNHIIVVGAVKKKENNKYPFANGWCYGDRVDILAPGGDLSIKTTSLFSDDGYDMTWGTSLAAPHVSGVAGLMYSVNPNITGSEIKSIIIETSNKDIVSEENLKGTPRRLLDAEAAVKAAEVLPLKGDDGDDEDEKAEDGDSKEEDDKGEDDKDEDDEKDEEEDKPKPQNDYAIVIGTTYIKGGLKQSKVLIKEIWKLKSNAKNNKFDTEEARKENYDNITQQYAEDNDTTVEDLKSDDNAQYELFLDEGTYRVVFEFFNTEKNEMLGHILVLDNLKKNTARLADIPLRSMVSIKTNKGEFLVLSEKDSNFSIASGEIYNITTNKNGYFFLDLPDGEYIISINEAGYKPRELAVEIIDGITYYNGEILTVIEIEAILANLVFCIDAREIAANLDGVKANIGDVIKEVAGKYLDVKIYLYTQKVETGMKVTHIPIKFTQTDENGVKTERDYFQSIDEIEKTLDKIAGQAASFGNEYYEFAVVTNFAISKYDDKKNDILIYHIIAGEDVIAEVGKAKSLSQILRDNVGRIYVSSIASISEDEIKRLSFAVQMADISGGEVRVNGY